MSKTSKLSRRTFLSRSAIATGGIISLSMIGTPGNTKPQETSEQETSEFENFTTHQGQTVIALAEQIFPIDENGPGATDAHVITYIDRALSTHWAGEKEIYDRGLAWLDQLSTATQGAPFVELTEDLQIKVMRDMDNRRRPPADWPADAEMGSREFLRYVTAHTMEGMFSDPQYGGNYNETGWKLLNFPGLKAFGYDAPFGYYDAVWPELEYPEFVPYTGPGK